MNREAAQRQVKPTPPSAVARKVALAVVLFGAGGWVSEGRAARPTRAYKVRHDGIDSKIQNIISNGGSHRVRFWLRFLGIA
jgi:hypothetical protein